jgi:hypothetical protein
VTLSYQKIFDEEGLVFIVVCAQGYSSRNNDVPSRCAPRACVWLYSLLGGRVWNVILLKKIVPTRVFCNGFVTIM